MNRTALLILIVVLFVLAMWLLFFNNRNNNLEDTNDTNTNQNNTPIDTSDDNAINPDADALPDSNGTNDDVLGDEDTDGTQASVENVLIDDFKFARPAITVKRGTRVIWTNMDDVQHTVTSTSGNELNSGLLTNGASYEHTFNTVGTFSYFCQPHPQMTGTVTVTE